MVQMPEKRLGTPSTNQQAASTKPQVPRYQGIVLLLQINIELIIQEANKVPFCTAESFVRGALKERKVQTNRQTDRQTNSLEY